MNLYNQLCFVIACAKTVVGRQHAIMHFVHNQEAKVNNKAQTSVFRPTGLKISGSVCTHFFYYLFLEKLFRAF